MIEALYESHLRSLKSIGRGKVRDLYEIDPTHLLMVATDRLSAFDVVFPTPIPGKGAILARLSRFWFGRTAHLVPNHLSTRPLEEVLPDPLERDDLGERAMVVRRMRPLPIEAIVRGYLTGSGWRDYLRSGRVCGIDLPPGMRQADRLPEPLYTPSSKAQAGLHDENVTFSATADVLGMDVATRVCEISLRIYQEAADYALERGIIIADTKFEFGLDEQGRLVLIDEVLTPDSSRFWPVERYHPGTSPPSFDKQFVRDYLERLGWNKRPPAPELPPDVVQQTLARYREAEARLTGG